MYIELIDLLRCPRDHEETWLVAAFTKMDGRYVVTGALGCPACSASYAIEKGIADLRDHPSGGVRIAEADPIDDVPARNTTDSALRVAAMLGLTRPDSLIALRGREAALAVELSELTECRVIALDPADSLYDTERVARVLAGGRIPLAESSLDGIVLTAGPARPDDAARVLKPTGRLVVSADAMVPAGFRELARDSTYIVAESVGPLVQLSR
jgi:uncharacterized protein YbaR (Trm112 family)